MLGSGKEMKKHEAGGRGWRMKAGGGSWAPVHSASGVSPAECIALPVSFLDEKRTGGGACGHTNGHLHCMERWEWGQWNRERGGTRRPSKTSKEGLFLGHQPICLFIFSFNTPSTPNLLHLHCDPCYILFFLGESALKMVDITTVPSSPLDVTISLWPCLVSFIIHILWFNPPGSIKWPDG